MGECNRACGGDSSQMCGGWGGGNPFVVYENGPSKPAGPTTPAPTRAPRTTRAPCTDCDFGEATGDCSAAAYDYAEVLDKSMLFYEAQRAGPLPADNRIPWRGDSNLNDDPVGGYYDAGDFLKFGLPMAHMTTQLAWGAINFQEGYEKTGQMKYIKDTIMWATDYFIDANRLPNEFIGQIGAGDADHGYWGRAEDMNMNRPVYSVSPSKPGSDLAGETAAALAAASIFYKNTGDDAASDEALANAIELFEFADQYRGKYSDSIWDASKFYNSWSGYMDELAWGAAWLYRATGDASYLQKAEDFFDSGEMCNSNLWFGWDNKKAGVEVLMYEITNNAKYQKCVDNFMNEVKGATYTPKGLIFVDNWGSNRHAGNLAHLAAQLAHMGYKETENNAFVEKQIGYILGDTGRSYMVGFGVNPPLRPHHRGSSCRSPMTSSCGSAEKNSPSANPQTLYGAIVGGPDGNDQYNDARDDYISNEVATDYNAGVQSAVAYLAMMNC